MVIYIVLKKKAEKISETIVWHKQHHGFAGCSNVV